MGFMLFPNTAVNQLDFSGLRLMDDVTFFCASDGQRRPAQRSIGLEASDSCTPLNQPDRTLAPCARQLMPHIDAFCVTPFLSLAPLALLNATSSL